MKGYKEFITEAPVNKSNSKEGNKIKNDIDIAIAKNIKALQSSIKTMEKDKKTLTKDWKQAQKSDDDMIDFINAWMDQVAEIENF